MEQPPRGTLKLVLADNGHDITRKVGTDEYLVPVGEELWAKLSAAIDPSTDEVRRMHWVVLKLQEQLPW